MLPLRVLAVTPSLRSLPHGLLTGQPLATCVEYGAAHGALAMTTPGDTSMVTAAEVLKLAGGNARVDR